MVALVGRTEVMPDRRILRLSLQRDQKSPNLEGMLRSGSANASVNN